MTSTIHDDDDDEEPDLLGKVVLGRYRIVRALARGGMGMIYLARSEGAADFVRPVVVKRMLSAHADASAVKMFKREARIMSALRHPGIVSVIDFGREDGAYLLVMDYVHGFHLGRWAGYVQQAKEPVVLPTASSPQGPGLTDAPPGQLPWALVVHILIQVLDALEHAHTLKGPDGAPLNIVHRDVSPSNVLLDVDGRVLLADFGIAKSSAEEETRTTVGTVKGKFSYMAPEILDGVEPGPSTDVWAAAVVLHELLVGRNEFRAADPSITVQRVLTHTPRRLDAVRPDVPTALADAVERALAKKREDRFPSAAEFARALRKVRPIDAEEAAAELKRVFSRDFPSPRFAALSGQASLDDLEQSWRTSPEVVLPPSEPPLRPSSEPTRQLTPPRAVSPRPGERTGPLDRVGPAAPPPPPSRSSPGTIEIELEPDHLPSAPAGPTVSAHPQLQGLAPLPAPAPLPTVPQTPPPSSPRWLVPTLAALLLAMLAAGFVFLLVRQSRNQEVVFVDMGPNGPVTSTPTEAPLTEPPAPEPVAEPAAEPPVTTDSSRTPTSSRDDHGVRLAPSVASPEAMIERAIARQRGEIRRCFEGSDFTETTIALRFTTDAAGAVASVQLTPPELESGTLGRCVIGAASRTTFGPGVGARSFRIPLRIRSE